MKLKILHVEDHGTLESERIFLSVIEDADLQNYIVRDSTYTRENRFSNKWVHAYEFTAQEVKAGDEVVVYTYKRPQKTEKINGGKNTRYNYSWNLKECVWNNDGDVAVLYELNNWKTTKVGPAKK